MIDATEKLLKGLVEISTICNPGEQYAKEYAKSAIRDVFIQMPSRSVYQIYMDSYLNQISSVYGVKETKLAWKELQTEGWVTTKGDKFFWKKDFGPVIQGLSEREKLNESPDEFYVKDIGVMQWGGSGSICFGYYEGVLAISIGKTHHRTSEMFSGHSYGRDSMKYPGRLFMPHHIISFWEYPSYRIEIYEIIKQINISYPFAKILEYFYSKTDHSYFSDVDITNSGFSQKFQFMKDEYVSGDINSLLNKIKNMKKVPETALKQIYNNVEEIYQLNSNYKINFNKIYVDTPGYYDDWDSLESEISTDEFYDKINDSNWDEVLIPLKKYGK